LTTGVFFDEVALMSAADIRLSRRIQRLPLALWWALPGLLAVGGAQALFIFTPQAPVTRPMSGTDAPVEADAPVKADAPVEADAPVGAGPVLHPVPPAAPVQPSIREGRADAALTELEVVDMEERAKVIGAWNGYASDVRTCLKQKTVNDEVDQSVVVAFEPKWNGEVSIKAIRDDLEALPASLRGCFISSIPSRQQLAKPEVNKAGFVRMKFHVSTK
jgi:hypothetical protein